MAKRSSTIGKLNRIVATIVIAVVILIVIGIGFSFFGKKPLSGVNVSIGSDLIADGDTVALASGSARFDLNFSPFEVDKGYTVTIEAATDEAHDFDYRIGEDMGRFSLLDFSDLIEDRGEESFTIRAISIYDFLKEKYGQRPQYDPIDVTYPYLRVILTKGSAVTSILLTLPAPSADLIALDRTEVIV